MAGPSTGTVRYAQFKQRVRRYPRTAVLEALAELAVLLQHEQFDQTLPLGLPNYVTPFALAGIARTALIAGSEHRRTPVTLSVLIEMCAIYANIHDPALDADPESEEIRGLMNRVAYEQFGFQYSVMENLGRSVLLIRDRAAACEGAPSEEDWRQILGVSLEEFMRIGFAMHVAALQNRGRIERDVLRMSHVAPIFTPHSADKAMEVIDEWFSATFEQLRRQGTDKEIAEYEKWSFNPLVDRPVIAAGDRFIIPWPRLVLDRVTPTGLYFIGLEAFGESFPEALGCMFEDYVGVQLDLLQHAVVYPQVVYGKPERRTVDWFVATREVVLLVEAKASRPVEATRLGHAAGDDDVEKKVGRAIQQIERTFEMLEEGHPAVAHINPHNLPVRGVVVTLEPFHFVNTFIYGDLRRRGRVPVCIASAHEMEGVIAALIDRADCGARLLNALTPDEPAPASLATAAEGLASVPNPLLDAAWQRFTAPWSNQGLAQSS